MQGAARIVILGVDAPAAVVPGRVRMLDLPETFGLRATQPLVLAAGGPQQPGVALVVGPPLGVGLRIAALIDVGHGHVAMADVPALEYQAPSAGGVDQVRVVRDEHADAPESAHRRGDGVAGRLVHMVGRFVEHQQVGALDQRAGDLHAFGLAAGERVIAVQPAVVQTQGLSDRQGFGRPIGGKVLKVVGNLIGRLRADRDDQSDRCRRDAPRIGGEASGGDGGQGRFADAVVAEHGGPPLGEGDRDVLKQRFGGTRIGEVDMG